VPVGVGRGVPGGVRVGDGDGEAVGLGLGLGLGDALGLGLGVGVGDGVAKFVFRLRFVGSGIALKLKFESMPPMFAFRLTFGPDVLTFMFLLAESSFCSSQNSPAPAPRTSNVRKTVKTTVFIVLDGGGGGG